MRAERNETAAALFHTIEHFSLFTPESVDLPQDLLDEVIRRETFVSLTVGFASS